jgi:hypothetical protein
LCEALCSVYRFIATASITRRKHRMRSHRYGLLQCVCVFDKKKKYNNMIIYNISAEKEFSRTRTDRIVYRDIYIYIIYEFPTCHYTIIILLWYIARSRNGPEMLRWITYISFLCRCTLTLLTFSRNETIKHNIMYYYYNSIGI